MYLVLGEPNTTILDAFRATIERRHQTVFLLKELRSADRFNWNFGSAESFSELVIGDQKIDATDIEGVLVQSPWRLDPSDLPNRRLSMPNRRIPPSCLPGSQAYDVR